MRAFAIGTAVSVFALSSPVGAQGYYPPPAPAPAPAAPTTFAQQGYFVLSAERLGGITVSQQTEEDGDSTRTLTLSAIGLGTSLLYNPYTAARPAFDAFVIDGLSVGAGIALWTLGGESESDGPAGSSSSNFDRIWLFTFAPRVGYALPLSEYFGFWPRAGVTYFNLSTEDDNDTTSGLALTLEAYFAIIPLDHFAVLLGPVADIGLTGKDENNNLGGTSSTDFRFSQYGLNTAVAGWF